MKVGAPRRARESVVNPHVVPPRQNFRFVLGQVGLHGKVRFRQIDSGFEVERHSVRFSQMIESFHYREAKVARLLAMTERPGHDPKEYGKERIRTRNCGTIFDNERIGCI
jgi:hypothetical protein